MTTSSAISILQMKRLILVAVLCVVGCVVAQPKRSLSFAELKSLPPFTALVKDVQLSKNHSPDGTDYLAVEIWLRREDGSKIIITTNRATLTQAAFAENLVGGRIYKWPNVITDFEAEMKLIQYSNHVNIARASSPTKNSCR